MRKPVGLMVIFLATLAISGWGIANDDPKADPKASRFQITSKKRDDRIETRSTNEHTVFNIHSPTGISEAKIERLDATWPKHIIMRLHMKGLESVKLSNGTITLAKDGNTIVLHRADMPSKSIDKKDPLWMSIQSMGADGKPTDEVPVKDGYFEIVVPQALLADNPKTLSLSWIDFYRN